MEEVTPSIVVLKTGEQIICDLKEIFDGEGEDRKGVCLLMVHPHVLSLVENTRKKNPDLQVKFTKWCPYSTDTQFKIPYDTIMAIGTSDTGLSEAYINKVSQLEQFNNTQQQVITPEVMPNE